MPEVRMLARLWQGKASQHFLAVPGPPADQQDVAEAPATVPRRRFLRAAAVLLSAPAAMPLLALSQAAAPPASRSPHSWPSRPVRLIVPFPAGGVPDTIARFMAERLTQHLGVPVEVDNRPSANGTTASDVVARASSDGHTLLLHQSTVLIQPGVEPQSYDVLRDFTPVARVVAMPLFLAVNGRLPVRTPQQWLDAARANPSAYSIGTAQPGTPAHLYAEYAIRGIPNGVPLVTAKGEAALVQEVLAGRISACFCNFAAVQPHLASGALRLLAVAGSNRSQLAPAVPTLAESGMDGYGAGPWLGILAPAKTPRVIVGKLAAALEQIVAEPQVRERLIEVGLTPLRDSPEAFATAIRSESIQWQVILRQAGRPVEP